MAKPSLNCFKINGELKYCELLEHESFTRFKCYEGDHRSKCDVDSYTYLCRRMSEVREERFRNTMKHKQKLLTWFDTMESKYATSKRRYSPQLLSQRINVQSKVSKQKRRLE